MLKAATGMAIQHATGPVRGRVFVRHSGGAVLRPEVSSLLGRRRWYRRRPRRASPFAFAVKRM
eukprot:4766023-Lingulodinium_polyedra.AAC.1